MKPGNAHEVTHAPGDPQIAAGAILGKLDDIIQLIRDAIEDTEQEGDFDQTFVVGGNFAAAAVFPFLIPRNTRHAEITLSVTAAVEVAVLPGNVSITQAGGQHSHSAGIAQNSNAICTTAGGQVVARDYLDGSGYLTVYFSAAANAYANVRVRSLDRMQARAERT